LVTVLLCCILCAQANYSVMSKLKSSSDCANGCGRPAVGDLAGYYSLKCLLEFSEAHYAQKFPELMALGRRLRGDRLTCAECEREYRLEEVPCGARTCPFL
jgi:hypothetical protein